MTTQATANLGEVTQPHPLPITLVGGTTLQSAPKPEKRIVRKPLCCKTCSNKGCIGRCRF